MSISFKPANHMTKSDSELLDLLQAKATELRKLCITISSLNKIPHLGSCLSCADILTVLYWHILNISPDTPNNDDRDRFLLSKGHASPIYLQLLALRGYFPKANLDQFGVDGSFFHEHPPKPGLIPGVEAATGSLGHGFSMALGMAYASKISNRNNNVFALLGDGECNEGVIWECALLAPKLNVDNFVGIIDFNKWQATGRSREVTSLSPLADKWEAFGWHTQEIDGHSISELIAALISAVEFKSKPSMIIANTVKGKGVSFMEDDNNWHYRTPNQSEMSQALLELGDHQ